MTPLPLQYEQFDKVLVIDAGRQVYFGPAKEARQYMIDLGYKNAPRQTTADYLSGCTDPNERQYQDGRSEKDVPSDAFAFAEAYRKSETYARMKAERDAYNTRMETDESDRNEFIAAVNEDKAKGVGKKSPYTVSFPMQVAALAKRQFQLKRQDKFGLYTGYFTSIAIAIVRAPPPTLSLNPSNSSDTLLPPFRSPEPSTSTCPRPLAVDLLEVELSSSPCFSTYVYILSSQIGRHQIDHALLPQALNAFSELPTQMVRKPPI